jgi:hypothetical protein
MEQQNVKRFKDFGIKTTSSSFTGDKIKVSRLLNRNIIVEDYKIETSKYTDKGNGKCLHLQLMIDGTKHVTFTGSGGLMEQIQQIDKKDFPFATVIEKTNDKYSFT